MPAIALPRPHPGPVAWSDPAPTPPPPLAWALILAGLVVALLTGGVAIRRQRRAHRGGVAPLTPEVDGVEAELPSHRLRLAALAVRAALVTTFGPAWNARTTEEVARDPALIDRFGPDLAKAAVAFLQRVDRVRFGGEACLDLDALIGLAPPLVAQLRESGAPAGQPLVNPARASSRSGERRRRRSRFRRSGA